MDVNETDVGWVPAAIADKSLRRRPLEASVQSRGMLAGVRAAD